MDYSDRYDKFQREAIKNIATDFSQNPAGRFLLVIPTGGGKTTTAVRSVHALFSSGQLNAAQDRVMWVVHRDELRTQALDTFRGVAARVGDPAFPDLFDVLMLSDIKRYLAEHPEARLAVIDEAHHVAAKSYQPLFERNTLGILGLTATPSRHDGQPLQFERESYSIGFPDLVSMGVLLRPNVITVKGGTYNLADIGNDAADLEALNNEYRNGRILEAIEAHRILLNKIIIYVGTKKHARDLYAQLKASPLTESYDSISLILGDERRRFSSSTSTEVADEPRDTFIKTQKATLRSILVNVDVLTEGYDDPSVNAVVMARPTNSKLVYMQALGRAVRVDPKNPDKDAYVIEVVDTLPNIRYRIDNRWLFSDIADSLEPAVLDIPFGSPGELAAKVQSVFAEYNVPTEYRSLPAWQPRDRITMLLFRVYVAQNSYEHIPLVITNDSRLSATRFFNYLASRMSKIRGFNIEPAIRPVLAEASVFPSLTEPETRKLVFQAMDNAWLLSQSNVESKPIPSPIEDGTPWITFVSFRLELTEAELGEDILAFTADMANREAVRGALRAKAYNEDFVLVKFPLPLRGSWGVFLAGPEFESVKAAIDTLATHANESDGTAQWQATVSVLGTTALPVEQRHVQSLSTIVRESIDYFRSVRTTPGNA